MPLNTGRAAKKVVILGAGCSGLSVAWGLADIGGFDITILDASSSVGGLSRTIERDGLRFDIGPHRLSTQLPGIIEKIRGLIGDDLLELENDHGVYFNGILYSYPPGLRDFFHWTSLRYTALFGLSWIAAQLTAGRRSGGITNDPDFENTILSAFGRAFSEAVAFPMIRKVWGTRDLHQDFARIRFEMPTFGRMLARFFFRNRYAVWGRFFYPAKGFGQIPDAIQSYIAKKGCRLELPANIRKIEARTLSGPFSVMYEAGGEECAVEADVLVSTISNRSLIRYLSQTGLADPILGEVDHFVSRTMRLGIVTVKNYRLRAKVIIFPEERFIFNRISAMDRFSDLGYPKDHTVLMCDVICDPGSQYDSMAEKEFDSLLLDSVLKLGWFTRDDVKNCFNLRIPGAYPVLSRNRYAAQEKIEALFESSGVILCGREASSDYNNAHNAIGKGFLAAQYIAGELDAATYQRLSKTVGRLPIQD